jgi:hypothetical protein
MNQGKSGPGSSPRENEEILGVVGAAGFEIVAIQVQVPNLFQDATRFGREPQ